jgi:hypothetical protein
MNQEPSEALTHEEAGEMLWAMIPHDISTRELEPYGIEVNERAAETLTRELLSLNLFWISLALHVPISRKKIDRGEAERVFGSVTKNAQEFLVGRFGYSRDELQVYSDETEQRGAEYHLALGEKSNPVASLTHFVLNLLTMKAIDLEDSDKALSAAVKLVPWSGLTKAAGDLRIVGEGR